MARSVSLQFPLTDIHDTLDQTINSPLERSYSVPMDSVSLETVYSTTPWIRPDNLNWHEDDTPAATTPATTASMIATAATTASMIATAAAAPEAALVEAATTPAAATATPVFAPVVESIVDLEANLKNLKDEMRQIQQGEQTRLQNLIKDQKSGKPGVHTLEELQGMLIVEQDKIKAIQVRLKPLQAVYNNTLATSSTASATPVATASSASGAPTPAALVLPKKKLSKEEMAKRPCRNVLLGQECPKWCGYDHTRNVKSTVAASVAPASSVSDSQASASEKVKAIIKVAKTLDVEQLKALANAISGLADLAALDALGTHA